MSTDAAPVQFRPIASAPPYTGEQQQPGSAPPVPPRPYSRTGSTSSNSSSGSPSLHLRQPTLTSPRAFNLDRELPGQQALVNINQRLFNLLEQLKDYNQQIEQLKQSIQTYANNPQNPNLKLAHDQKLKLVELIQKAREEFAQISHDFITGDGQNLLVWSKSSQWQPFETYKKTSEEVGHLLGSMQLPDMPAAFYEYRLSCAQSDAEQLRQQLRAQQSSLPKKDKGNCIIL